MEKPLLTTEELNALLSPEQVSEPVPADRPVEPIMEPAKGESSRIRQLETDVIALLKRVEELESRLGAMQADNERLAGTLQTELTAHAAQAAGAAEAAIAAHAFSAPQPQPRAQEAQALPAEVHEAPLRLSRVETYKQQQKPKKSLFRS